MEKIDVRLFGTFSMSPSSGNREIALSRTLQILFSYLLLFRSRLHHRDVLGSLLWADRSNDQARKCLSTALWRLRKTLDIAEGDGGGLVYATKTGEIGVDMGFGLNLDIARFEDRLGRVLSKKTSEMTEEDAVDLEKAHQLYTGHLLEGFFEEWILRERERLRGLYLRALHRLMEYNAEAGRLDAAIDYAEVLLRLEPLREDLHRRLMRLLVATGRRALAVSRYKSLCTMLREELGVPPVDETQILYRRIVQEEDGASFLSQQTASADQPDLKTAYRLLENVQQSFETVQAQISQALTAFKRVTDNRN